MRAQDIPIYRGHFIANPYSLELGWWKERECNAAFIQLEGMQGVSEARITEIAPGASIAPLKMAISEVVYCLEGQGLAAVWSGDGPKKTFEFGPRSLFCLPRHCWHQLSNARGDQPVRLLNYNYLPPTMSTFPDPSLIFNNNIDAPELIYQNEFYAEAKMITVDDGTGRRGAGVSWQANFVPDMGAWDKLVPFWGRGAGGSVVRISFPRAEMACHMSVFGPQLYKKGHRHGPGRVIVIPKGEGYSVLWPGNPTGWGPLEGAEKVVCPWQEGTIFVPPEMWYHQHFNTGTGEGRYLALGPQRAQFQGTPYSHQIEYPYEDPWIRNTWEGEIGKKGMQTLMPKECYEDPTFEWDYGNDD
jgi:oxalate decarboxylase/phosphoglucose isomerase-like protein (cupin superfamily)